MFRSVLESATVLVAQLCARDKNQRLGHPLRACCVIYELFLHITSKRQPWQRVPQCAGGFGMWSGGCTTVRGDEGILLLRFLDQV